MKLHVVNASVAEPVFASLPLSLNRSERLLETCGLNPMLLDSATGLIPLHSAEEVVCRAHRYSDDPCWAFNLIASTSGDKKGAIANIPLRRHSVALDAVQDFVRAIDGVLTGTRFFLDWDRETVWIKRTTSTTDWSDTWALVFYNFSVFLQGMRSILGDDIRPVAALVACVDDPPAVPEPLGDIPIVTGARYTGLGFDRRLLSRPVRRGPVSAREDGQVYSALSTAGPETMIRCLSSLLASNATDRLADRAARAFGLSRRTYQRQLARLGTSHRELAADARLSLALELLADEAWSVTHIAYELGYRHPGDFSRFFRDRTGLSPVAHRAARRSPV